MLKKPHLVAVVAYDGLCTFEFGCVVELFALRRPELGVDWYRFGVCSAERGPLRAAGGIRVEAPYSLALLDKADTIIVPGWRDADEAPPKALLAKIRRAYQRGARLCTICSGVFVLAAAGVLDGKTVTTHWRYAEKLARGFPSVTVEPNSLYVDQGKIITSAGSAAGLDMMLHMVRLDFGPRIANLVAQRLVIPPHRAGGQAQYVSRPMPRDEKSRLSQLMEWVRGSPRLPHTLRSLAKRAAMSPRTLQRQFQQTTGMGPGDWLIRERVTIAKEMLEVSSKPIPRIAELAGFGSEESLRRHFRLIVGVPPTVYRKQFGAT